jgi:hypothetical protein
MEEMFVRFWENLMSRPAGPMHLRFIFQPIVASVLAIRSGLSDAREGRSGFLVELIMHHGNRRALMSEAWSDIGKLFIMACLLDLIFQVIALRWFYPLETFVVAIILSFVPYVIVRTFTRSIAKMFRR